MERGQAPLLLTKLLKFCPLADNTAAASEAVQCLAGKSPLPPIENGNVEEFGLLLKTADGDGIASLGFPTCCLWKKGDAKDSE